MQKKSKSDGNCDGNDSDSSEDNPQDKNNKSDETSIPPSTQEIPPKDNTDKPIESEENKTKESQNMS